MINIKSEEKKEKEAKEEKKTNTVYGPSSPLLLALSERLAREQKHMEEEEYSESKARELCPFSSSFGHKESRCQFKMAMV